MSKALLIVRFVSVVVCTIGANIFVRSESPGLKATGLVLALLAAGHYYAVVAIVYSAPAAGEGGG